MDPRRDVRLLDAIERCAPGEPLREGLERILRAGRGALIVLGPPSDVDPVCSGGFAIDAEFTAYRLAELAKMDGAIICDAAGERIRMANVHLVPHRGTQTDESGIRHRSAERTARQTGATVIAVSESMRTLTLYAGDAKYLLDRVGTIINRANQGLQTLQRYRQRFDEAAQSLSGLEVADLVTIRDVTSLVQRAEMILRIADELEWWIVELGLDGRLLRMQADELLAGIEDERELVVRDYFVHRGGRKAETVIAHLAEMPPGELADVTEVAYQLGLPSQTEELDNPVAPRGYRLLAKIPRIPRGVEENIVKRFGSLQRVMQASMEELDDVEGVGEARARAIKEGLDRLVSASLADRVS